MYIYIPFKHRQHFLSLDLYCMGVVIFSYICVFLSGKVFSNTDVTLAFELNNTNLFFLFILPALDFVRNLITFT